MSNGFFFNQSKRERSSNYAVKELVVA